jgi:hypothetical protein
MTLDLLDEKNLLPLLGRREERATCLRLEGWSGTDAEPRESSLLDKERRL